MTQEYITLRETLESIGKRQHELIKGKAMKIVSRNKKIPLP